MTDKVVYLDNNATTRVDPAVFEAVRPYFETYYGNPSSMHVFGGQLANELNAARGQVAALLGAEAAEIIFTSGGTEGDNAAILSGLRNCPSRRKLVVSKVEHPAVLNLGKELSRQGYKVAEAPVDRLGRLDMERLAELIDADTAVVSIMWANNETGNLYPVEEVAAMAHRRGALFHTDAVQAVGKVPINLAASEIDMLSLSGHKLHAPKGIGAMYVRHGVRFKPLIIGGHQEHGRRAGTENVPGIVALGAACELAMKNMAVESSEVRRLRDRLEAGLLKAVPKAVVNGDPAARLPNTSNISFEFIEGEGILLHLNDAGIAASSGSACTSGSLEPSHVLRAMGVPYTLAHGSIRFSLSRFNTEREIDYVIEKLPPIVVKLRGISPYWNALKS